MGRATHYCLMAMSALTPTGGACTGEADVVDVKITGSGEGTFAFDVTVRHADTGRDHIANRWEIPGPDGAVLGTRELAHPHEAEQPFTRSLSGVATPAGIMQVRVRAHESMHGFGGAKMTLAVPRQARESHRMYKLRHAVGATRRKLAAELERGGGKPLPGLAKYARRLRGFRACGIACANANRL